MIIAGLDWSKNNPAVAYMDLDGETLEIERMWFRTVSKVKKISFFKPPFYCHAYESKNLKDDMMKAVSMRDEVLVRPSEFRIEYAAVEGYAYGAKGQVFDIGESCMAAKLRLYEEHHAKIRIYDIGVHKKAFSGRGDSDKVSMWDAYWKNYPEDPMKLKEFKLPEPMRKEGVSPTSDIIDSFSVCCLLRTELVVRAGLKDLKDLPDHVRQAFLYVSKSQPQNLLTTDFICKPGYE